MTGENFMRLNRHNEKLERLLQIRKEAGQVWQEIMYRLRDEGEWDGFWEELHKAEERCERLDCYIENMGGSYYR